MSQREKYVLHVMGDPKWLELADRANERAILVMDEWGQFPKDIDFIAEILGDLYVGIDPGGKTKKAPKDWVPKGGAIYADLSDLSLLANAANERGSAGKLETYLQLVQDAAQWALEEAAMPRFWDIEWSFNRAVADSVEHDGRDLDYSLWDPIMDEDIRWENGKGILRDLIVPGTRMTQTVPGPREKRYEEEWSVVFTPWGMAPTRRLIRLIHLASPPDLGPLEDALAYEFQGVFRRLVDRFWKVLEKDMSEVDLINRAHFDEFKKHVLADKDRVAEARDEMVEVLRESRRGK